MSEMLIDQFHLIMYNNKMGNFNSRVNEIMDKIYNKGIDDCEFYIQTNKGHKVKPVVKIASGGEVSRIMLAIKILMQNKINHHYEKYE